MRSADWRMLNKISEQSLVYFLLFTIYYSPFTVFTLEPWNPRTLEPFMYEVFP
jgi:hypothetical protein